MGTSKTSKKLKRHEYPHVWVKCDLAWSTGGECLTDEEFSDRADEQRHYEVGDWFLTAKPKEFHYDPVPVPDWDPEAKVIYAVVVHYSTGDTFGRIEGCIDLPIAFVSYEEAQRVAKELQADSKKDETFVDSKYGFFKSWTGYFESLDGVEVKPLHGVI